jgi:hypothetical protein
MKAELVSKGTVSLWRLHFRSGVHAAAFTALIRASRRRGAWLGGAAEGEKSPRWHLLARLSVSVNMG